MIKDISSPKERIKTYFDDLFKQHQSLLSKYYPGLTSQYLFQSFFDYGFRTSWKWQDFLYATCWDMDDSVFDQFWSMVLKGIPLEYIVGKKYFYNSYIYLSSGVFIPRSESELIVDKVVSLLKKRSREELYLLDVCTGPGTLLLSILKNIHQCPIYGIGVDISPLALDWARKNTLESRYLLSEGHQCHWMLSDRLSALDPQWRFDVIVSNPPYIPRSRQDSVHLQVQTYEPHEALFLEDEHYEEWFQLFFTQVKHFLKPHGLFMMEGHENCLQKLVKIGKDVGLNSLVIEKDFSEQDRFLWMY